MSDLSPDKAPSFPERRAHARRESDAERDKSARLLALVPEAILSFDRNWVITYANAEAIRISRIQPSDIHSKTHWQLFPDTLGTDIETRYRRVMETGVPDQLEHFYAPFRVWVYVHVFPSEEGVTLYYRDITPRKQAESLRDAAIQRLQQVFDSIPDSVVCIDHSWRCTFANRAALKILKADNLIGENLWVRYPSNNQEPFRSNYLASMERRVPTEFEAYYPAPLDIWFKVSVRPYEDGIIIFSSDITDRKGAELLRDASARHLSQVLETTSDAVISINRDWQITFLNRRAKELLGPQGDLVGKDLWQEFPDAAKSGSQIDYHYRRAMEQGTASDFQIFYPAPLDLWLAIQCRPYEDGIVVFFRDITAARQSEAALKQQQNLLASIQHTALVATWDVEYATGKVTFGAGAYPVFGHPLNKIRDFRAFKKVLVPEYIPIIKKCIHAAVETGQLIVQEFQVRAADGSLLWLESRGQAVFEDGRCTSIRGLTIDIGERKKNEEALVASEARYRVLADLNPQAIWMGDPDGNITYANQGFLDYIGLTIETLGGMGWLNAFHPDERARVVQAWTHSVTTGDIYDIEARLIRTRDGLPRWWWLRAQPVRDEAGKVLHWLGVAVDIDDRKTFAETLQQRQEETERQRAELETVYRTAPVGLGLFDPVEFRYLRLNDRLAEIIGLPPADILGRPITEVAPSEVREIFEQVIATKSMQRRLIKGEFPNRPGEEHFFNVNYSPVFAPDGSIQAIATATLDITHQKKAEAALIQSEKLAAVGRLASSISHEINNPLEAITNLLYLVNLSEDLPEGVRQYVHTAQSELSRVCQIATQTLRFHRQAVGPTRIVAGDLVQAVLNLYQGRLANSNVQVDATYSTTTPIICFENDIRQVLNNLIANAIDAMRQGGRLIIRTHDATDRTPKQKPRKGVRITIADTGHGMSPVIQSRIFEPFFTTKDLNGTGLGLWISEGIVNRHQGRLTLRSSQHHTRHGTVFSLFLPLVEEPVPRTPTQATFA